MIALAGEKGGWAGKFIFILQENLKMSETPNKFETYAILEIMGHQKYAGLVTEQAVGGAAFVRVDVPEIDGRPAFSKLFSGGSIFCITPVSQEVALATAKGLRQAPLNVWDLPEDMQAKLRAPAITHAVRVDEDYDDTEYPV